MHDGHSLICGEDCKDEHSNNNQDNHIVPHWFFLPGKIDLHLVYSYFQKCKVMLYLAHGKQNCGVY